MTSFSAPFFLVSLLAKLEHPLGKRDDFYYGVLSSLFLAVLSFRRDNSFHSDFDSPLKALIHIPCLLLSFKSKVELF